MKIATIEDIKLEAWFRTDPNFKIIAYNYHNTWYCDREDDKLYWKTKNKDYINIKNLSDEHIQNILNLFYYKTFQKCIKNKEIQDLQKITEIFIKYLNKYN